MSIEISDNVGVMDWVDSYSMRYSSVIEDW